MRKILTAEISVIIPCFQCISTINRAVSSVLFQSLLPYEIILVDDCSLDGTLVVLEKLAQGNPRNLKIVKMEINKGAAAARNAGWAVATQPYIAFLDADDAWHPSKLEIQYGYMIENPSVVLCGHGYRQLNQNILPNWKVIPWDVRKVEKWDLMLSNRFITPSVMVRRNILQRFVENQRYMEDHMLWLEIICSGEHVSKLTAELASTYKGAYGVNGLSSHLWLMERADLGNYQKLYSSRHINTFQFYILCTYSLLKFVRRFLINYIRFLWTK